MPERRHQSAQHQQDAPLTSPHAIGNQSRAFSTTAAGVQRWNRAITSGMLNNQIVRLTTPAYRVLCQMAQRAHSYRGRFLTIIGSSGSRWLAFHRGTTHISPATERNDSWAPA